MKSESLIKSSSEFDRCLGLVLQNIRDGKFGEFDESLMTNDDCAVLLEYALDNDLATGFFIKRGAQNDVLLSRLDPKLTRKGLAFLEGKNNELPIVNQTFNIASVNNSMIGIQNNSSISVSDPFNELRERAKQECSSTDQIELNVLLEKLQEVIESGKPIEKGMFASFSDLLSKYAWLLGPIATELTKHTF